MVVDTSRKATLQYDSLGSSRSTTLGKSRCLTIVRYSSISSDYASISSDYVYQYDSLCLPKRLSIRLPMYLPTALYVSAGMPGFCFSTLLRIPRSVLNLIPLATRTQRGRQMQTRLRALQRALFQTLRPYRSSVTVQIVDSSSFSQPPQ